LVMASFASLKAVAALFLVIVFALFASTAAKRQTANVDGYVYEKCADYKLVGPVSGAVVSTSVDATTATTDAAGHFHLLTKNPVFSDEFYDVKVRSGEVVVGAHTGLSPTSRLTFALSPPESVAAGRDRKSGQMFCHAFPPGPAVVK
jgi:hypothetical protein